MNDHEPTSAEERDAQQALRKLSRPKADPVARARLRRSFADGSIRPGLTEIVGDPRVPGVAPARARVTRGPWLADRRAQLGLAVAAAAIAVAVLALNRPGKWTVTDTTGEGIAVVDGRAIPIDHHEELAAAMRPGARVRVPVGTEIEVASAAGLLMQLTAGTDATLPALPGRWFNRRVRGEIRTGELRITTGRSFRGAQLAIGTPEAQVEVLGTTLAVIREPHGTCVCVLEGRVRVGPTAGDMAEVESGHLRFVFNDGRAPGTDDMRPIEREKLGMLKESRGGVLDRR